MEVDLSIPKLEYNFDSTKTLTDIVKYYYPNADDEIVNMWVIEAENFLILTYENPQNMILLVDAIYYVRRIVNNKLNKLT